MTQTATEHLGKMGYLTPENKRMAGVIDYQIDAVVGMITELQKEVDRLKRVIEFRPPIK